MCDEIDDAERARRHAVTTSIADVRLNEDVVELVADDRARRTSFHAARVRAMLAHVAHHVPRRLDDRSIRRCRALDERDVTPRRTAECDGVVVRMSRKFVAVRGQLIPLLARDLARLAPDAQRRVGEEPGAHLQTTLPEKIWRAFPEQATPVMPPRFSVISRQS